MSKAKKQLKPIMVVPFLVVGNGKITKLDKILHDRKTRHNYEELLKRYDTKPELLAKAIREATWKGKTLDDMLAELGSC